MRVFEILLAFVNLLAFVSLVMTRLHPQGWLSALALLAPLAGIAQVVLEGPRWQMIPAYGLSILFFSVGVLGIALPGGWQADRTVLFLSGAAGLLLLLIAIALPVVLPVFRFPKPSGPYPIGTLVYHWVDENRPELFSPDPTDRRELMAQVWYPAQAQSAGAQAAYISDADAVTGGLARLTRYPDFFFSHFKYVTTNAVPSAPVAAQPAHFPVLIFLSGLGGFRASNTFQVEELVSHGYIVVGLDQPGGSALVRFPDGHQISGWSKAEIEPLTMQSIEPQPTAPSLYGQSLPEGILPYFAQDVSFSLDQLAALNASDPLHTLTGRLDLERAGIFGISLGGENAAEACLKDARLKACHIMDVWMPANVVANGLSQPTMFITRDADTMRLERQRSGGWTEKDIALTLTTQRAVYESLSADGYYLEIPRMFHLNFTDAPFWLPIASQIGLSGPIETQRGFDILNAYTLAFFDRTLKNQPAALLNGPSADYPEVHIETRPHASP